MTNVFYTKKTKNKWRARKRKMEKASAIGCHDDGDGHDIIKSNNNDNQSNKHRNSRKRTSDQISFNSINGTKHQLDESIGGSSSDVHQIKKAKQQTTIAIPANLTSKEAKKFRKDARRKARTNGQSEDQIKFITEGQAEEEDEPSATASAGGVDNEIIENGKHNKQQAKKIKKKECPRINDLLTEHAKQQKLDEKIAKQKSINDVLPPSIKQQYIAIDCEMVGIGIDGKKSALARCSIVNWDGDILLDTFVRVPERVTDFRTHVSGVRSKDIHVTNDNAMDPNDCRQLVGELLFNKILVGHALKNDLTVLMLSHPRSHIRDTSRYKPFMRPSGRGGGKFRPRKLRDLVYEHLGKRIQVQGESHDSVDDARASMELFKLVKSKWEKELDEKIKKKKKKG